MTAMRQLRPTSLFTPSAARCAEEVLNWARDYISQPHARLGRDGAVCPFVPPAIKAEALHIAVHEEVDDTVDAAQLEELLRRYIEVFRRTPPSTGPEKTLKTIVTAFPNLSARRAVVLDEVHAGLKTYFVHQGMMLGQFHPRCRAPAARNPEFANKVSPVPLFALRYIAVHDILFLGSRPDWFAVYRSLYGSRYEERDRGSGNEYQDAYRQALNRFPPLPAASPGARRAERTNREATHENP
ncbi:DUF6875 domain-containing protein [Streptomyces sp. NPDC048718]|uniref:DUF6875 domain-containing protein n=1 Tax=Streptomyces sp. NPDC048718 TaxID=3365587 RepID=UPI00372142D9